VELADGGAGLVEGFDGLDFELGVLGSEKSGERLGGVVVLDVDCFALAVGDTVGGLAGFQFAELDAGIRGIGLRRFALFLAA